MRLGGARADLVLGETVELDAAAFERRTLVRGKVLHRGFFAFNDQRGRPSGVVIGEHARVEHDQATVIERARAPILRGRVPYDHTHRIERGKRGIEDGLL